jgi:TolB-like protein/Tfp pilus assembly protein PilF
MPTTLRFDCFEVDLAAGQLFKRGARIHLREQSFQVLAMLLERPGQVVTREELRRRLWPDDVFVDFDNNLNTAVARLREVLNDSPERPRYIETLPKHGYRFMASLSGPALAPERARAQRVRVVVLPFVNLSGDPGQEHVSDAVTDDIITELASAAPEHLAVIARTTAMYYKSRSKDVTRIGRELSVDYVVEGGVRRADDRFGINVQVIRTSDQEHVFAKRYDADAKEIFGLQGRIARAVADHIGVSAGIEEICGGAAGGDRVTRKPTDDVLAYNEYVHGCRYLDSCRNGEDAEKAREHFEEAVGRDPRFALAYEALAQLYWFQAYFGLMPPRDAFAVGIFHAVRALEIDNTRAETHALLAQYRKQLDYNWPDIERDLTRALELDPASPLVRSLYAFSWLMPQGRLQAAIVELERALERDPLSIWVNTLLGVMLVLARQWDRAICQANLMIELDPVYPAGPWILGIGFRGKGLPDEAIAAHRRAVDLAGGTAMMLGWFGLVLGASGKTDEARGVLDRLEVKARTTYVPPTSFAWVYLGLGDVDRAFEWLDRAVDARDQFMMPIKTYAFFDPIRADPRFHALLRKMKLE